MAMAFECIISETRGAVGVITFNRPKALNALNAEMIAELNVALDGFDADAAVGAIVLTGSEKAFAAGADIREMKDFTAVTAHEKDFLGSWDHITSIRKPIIAAVSGYCLGGGFEYALIADILIAADTAKFALPEITLGIFPGLGGTQRLTRIIGKTKAMEMILTGKMIDATEAERLGIAAQVVAADQLMIAAMAMAEKIASMSQPVVAAAKHMVNGSLEQGLESGLKTERAAFYECFDRDDQKEGMAAFLEKRKAVFQNS
jgi:enoyl-CoA hydratase